MFRAGRAEQPEAELSPSLPATVARKSADYFSVTSPAQTTKKSRARVDIDWSDLFKAGSAQPLEAELSPPATDPVAPRFAYSADSISASWATHLNRGASRDSDWRALFKASSRPRTMKKRSAAVDSDWSALFKASSPLRPMKKKRGAQVDADWSAMFKASSPPCYMKKHSASAEIDWTDMFKASSPSRPMKKRGAQVDIDWTDMFGASSRPMKKRGAQVDTDWTAMFKTSSPPPPMKKRSASADIDWAAMFNASSLSRPPKKHSARVDIDWTAMFKARIAEPPKANLSPEAPDAVALSSASSADFVSDSPWAHLMRKPGARKDIGWSTMFNAGTAEPPEAELLPPVPATLTPRVVLRCTHSVPKYKASKD